MNGFETTPSQSGSRVDWSRTTRAVRYVQKTLGRRFLANGKVRDADWRGWQRNRLREFLERFPTADEAQRWVEAAAFKARSKDRPMAYFVGLLNKVTADRNLLDPARLLSAEEHSAWLRERATAKAGGCS